MINVSRRLSNVWSKLQYQWGEVYMFPARPPENHGATSVSVISGETMIEGWPDDKVIVHVDPCDRVLLFKLNEPNKFIEPWHGSQPVCTLKLQDINTTMMNLIEFRLCWDYRAEFVSAILEHALLTPPVVKPSKKTWWVGVKDEGFDFIFASKQQVDKLQSVYQQIPVEQIPLLMTVPELPVDFYIVEKIIHVWVPHLTEVMNIWKGSLEAREHVLFTLPAGVITHVLLSDTTHNLVAGDKLNWGKRLVERFCEAEIIMDDEDVLSYQYPVEISPEHELLPLPSF